MFACKRCGENLCCQGMSICRYCRYEEEGVPINVMWHKVKNKIIAIHVAISDCIENTEIRTMDPKELRKQVKIQREMEK